MIAEHSLPQHTRPYYTEEGDIASPPLRRNRSDRSLRQIEDQTSSNTVKKISEKYFKDVAPILLPMLFLALVGNEVIAPPEKLPEENKIIYRSAISLIGIGQVLALSAAILSKAAPQWCKDNKEKVKTLHTSSAVASSLAGAAMITNATLLETPATSYVTPIAFANLGLTKLAGSAGCIPEKAMKLLGIFALMGATVGFGFFTDVQKKEGDNIGLAITSSATTALGLNTLQALYQLFQKKPKETQNQPTTELSNIHLLNTPPIISPETIQHGVSYYNPTFIPDSSRPENNI